MSTQEIANAVTVSQGGTVDGFNYQFKYGWNTPATWFQNNGFRMSDEAIWGREFAAWVADVGAAGAALEYYVYKVAPNNPAKATVTGLLTKFGDEWTKSAFPDGKNTKRFDVDLNPAYTPKRKDKRTQTILSWWTTRMSDLSKQLSGTDAWTKTSSYISATITTTQFHADPANLALRMDSSKHNAKLIKTAQNFGPDDLITNLMWWETTGTRPNTFGT